MELVSTIIPAYNAEKFITRAIDTVIAQTYPNIEIIVVDEGSEDETVALTQQKLRRDFKGQWQVIEFGNNRGVSAARNAALRAANGSWIQSLDADDFLAPTKFEKQMVVCVKAPSDVAAVCSPWRQVFADGQKIEWAGPLRTIDALDKPPIMNLVADCASHHGAFLIRHSTLEKIGGFDESLRIHEDAEMLVRLAAQGGRFEFVYSSEPLYLSRAHRDRPLVGGPGARYRLENVATDWIDAVLKAAGKRPLSALQMSVQDLSLLQNECAAYARHLYPNHRDVFQVYMTKVRILFPKFNPTHPWFLLSRCVGYENAEAVAQLVRRLKKLFQTFLEKTQYS
jgi:glycosyltransferase involved in cell wall biosynthesis